MTNPFMTDADDKAEYKEEVERGYIKLYKNSRGYNWEVKLFEGKDPKAVQELIKEIENIDTQLKDKFESGSSDE